MQKLFVLSIMLFGLVITGCKKIITEKPYSFLTPDNFPSSEAEANVALFGSYAMLQEMGAFAYVGTYILNLQNDELQQAVYAGGRDAYFWRVFWKGINSANNLIETLDKMDASENPWIPQKVAEARALRALFYFYLVRMWGDIPLRLHSTTETVLIVPRSPVQNIYDSIILPDLEFADSKLPVQADGGGRFTDGAVKSLLANVYLTLAGWRRSSQGEMVAGDPSYWAKARDKAMQVIDMESAGIYTLEPHYSKLFTDLSTDVYNPEVILDVEFSKSKGSTFPYMYGADNSGNGPSPSWGGGGAGAIWQIEWLREQDKNDERYKWNVADYEFVDGWTKKPITDSTQYTATKWQKIYPSTAYWQDYLTNWPLFRLAEIKLIYAEAANEANGGPTPQAYAQINEVRYRARPDAHKTDGTVLPDLSGLSQQQFREAIISERSKELNLEGKRKFDLIRWGILKEKVESHKTQQAAIEKVNPRFYLFPMPVDDLTINSWTQNDGY